MHRGREGGNKEAILGVSLSERSVRQRETELFVENVAGSRIDSKKVFACLFYWYVFYCLSQTMWDVELLGTDGQFRAQVILL